MKYIFDKITIGFSLVYGLAASLVALHRYWQYEMFYDSFGLFDSVLWQVSRFRMPIIDHVALGRLPVFADHLYPTILLLAPIYWITSRSEVLLILQTLSVSLSGIVLYDIGKKVTGYPLVSFGIMTAYLLFVGLQNALITDVHEITIATLPLMLTFWAIVTNRKKLFYFFLLLTLGCKETMMFTGIGIGLFLLFQSSWKKHGWYTMAISILCGYIGVKLIIPYFSQGVYLYTPELPREPMAWITRLFDAPEKRATVWYSFQSFLFLPILSPLLLPLVIGDFVTRFIPANSGNHWTLGMHYNALTAVYLGVAAVYGVRKILKFSHALILILLIGNAVFLHQRILHGPLGLSYNPAFYRHTNNFTFLDTLVAQVPQTASVMTQSNLAPRFAHQEVYLLDMNYDMKNPQYIVVDLRDGQNPNNFFGMHGPSLPALLEKLSSDINYQKIYTQGDQHIWRLLNNPIP